MSNKKDEWVAEATHKLAVARRFIFKNYPIIGSAMARMDVHIECSDKPGQIPAAKTDSYKNIWIDARRVAQQDDKRLVFLIVHEVLHKMFRHNGRVMVPALTTGDDKLDAMLSNCAKDFVINKVAIDEILKDKNAFVLSDELMGEPIPTTRDNFWQAVAQSQAEDRPIRLYDPSVTEKDTSESIYIELLDSMPEPPPQEPEPDDEGDEGEGEGGEGESQPQPGQGQGKPDPMADQGGAPGQPGQSQPQPGQPGQPGQGQLTLQQIAATLADREGADDCEAQPQDEDGKPVDLPAIEAEDKMTGQAVATAIEQSEKRQGHVPGYLKRLLAGTKKPAINPRALLERYVRKRTAKSDYSMRRLRRIGIHFGLMQPTMRSEEIGDLFVAIDTSGSVTDREIRQYASDIQAVQRVMKPTSTTVVYFDTRIAGEQTFKRGQKLALKPKGGGGTNFLPVFKRLEGDKKKYDLVLILTDGYADDKFPARLKPKQPVVWLVYDGNTRLRPSWGDVVHVKIKG